MTTPENINTGSTGGLGLAHRSYDRWYLNYAQGAVETVGTLARLGRMGQWAIDGGRRKATRAVARLLVGQTALQDALSSPELSPLVEAAVPTPFHSPLAREPLWMMLGSVNHQTRRSLMPIENMIEVVDQAKQRTHITPGERINDFRDLGYTFISRFSSRQIAEVFALWKDSFEWDREGVKKLAFDLHANRQRSPADRSVWFSAVLSPKSQNIVALATAERLDLPITKTESAPIVETTEWRRAESATQHGLAAAAVAHLNAQIIRDLREKNPVIVGETNFLSGAHNVGFAAGMEVPTRRIGGNPISQMLIQNVHVGDGLEPNGLKDYRDFTVMHLPQSTMQTVYDEASTRSMLKGDI